MTETHRLEQIAEDLDKHIDNAEWMSSAVFPHWDVSHKKPYTLLRFGSSVIVCTELSAAVFRKDNVLDRMVWHQYGAHPTLVQAIGAVDSRIKYIENEKTAKKHTDPAPDDVILTVNFEFRRVKVTHLKSTYYAYHYGTNIYVGSIWLSRTHNGISTEISMCDRAIEKEHVEESFYNAIIHHGVLK